MSTELKKDGTLQLEIHREFPFPRDMVLDAWTNKDHLSKWMGPTPEITLALTEVVLKHQRFATEDACEKHRLGWEGTFTKQLRYFEGKLD